MKWLCDARSNGWTVLTSSSGKYRGHVLERAMEIIDGESRTPWVGWRCVHCGDRFALPGELDRYDLPLMERVEVEELPTGSREAAALTMALAASASGQNMRQFEEADCVVGSIARTVMVRALRNSGKTPLDRYALAEALIRNGEV